MNKRIQKLIAQATRIEEPDALFPRAVFDIKKFVDLVAAAEREACARTAITTPDPDDEYISVRSAIATAIRARGGE